MRIQTTTSFCLGDGKGDVAAGVILRVPDDISLIRARQILALNNAVEVAAAVEPIKTPGKRAAAEKE